MQEEPHKTLHWLQTQDSFKFKFTTSLKTCDSGQSNCKQESQAMTVKMLNAHASGNQGPKMTQLREFLCLHGHEQHFFRG